MMQGPNARAFARICAAVAAMVVTPTAMAQPPAAAASGALDTAAEGKVAAPAAAATTQPGSDADTPQKALMRAIAANDPVAVIANGGTAVQAGIANYLRIRNRGGFTDPAEEQFISQQFAEAKFAVLGGDLVVGYGIGPGGRGIAGVYRFPGVTLPEGNAGLPNAESLAGDIPIALMQLAEPLPPGPARTLPDIPGGFVTKAP